MGSSVESLFAAAGLTPARPVRWGESVPLDAPGVYAVSTTSDPTGSNGPIEADIDPAAVATLLRRRPEATVDGRRADTTSVTARLRQLWVAGEPVVYIGLAGTSVRRRIQQYHRTDIGARAPHAGGWPLKMLATLPELWVHFAATNDPKVSETAMISAFIAGVTPSAAATVVDPTTPLPFANLEIPGGRRKLHGFKGVKEPKRPRGEARTTAAPEGSPRSAAPALRPSSPSPVSASASASFPAGTATPTSPATVPTTSPLGARPTQRVTQNDIDRGQIRIPSASKAILPDERAQIRVDLHDELFDARWNPRNGPDRERSGLIGIPKAALTRLVEPGGPLSITRIGDIYEIR